MHGPNRLTCEEVFARLDDFIDRELSAEEIRLVREHLETCAACASEHRFESSVLDGVRAKLRRIAVPEHLRAAILAAVSRKERAPET
jgi:anti-sigma factor (TIGR02949 family)